MNTHKIYNCPAVFFTLLLFAAVPALGSEDGMGNLDLDMEISTTLLHEWMPSVTYNSIENEYLVLWHSTGVRDDGGENMYSLHARRISSYGQLLGESFSPLKSVGPERRLLPRAVHNPFTNQYIVSFSMGQEATDWDPFITILDSKGSTLFDPAAISEEPTKASHPGIVFNTTRRQCLVVYNDSRTGLAAIYGIIIDEDGNIVKGDFVIKASENPEEGGFINAFACYNPTNDTYLINWEDFRNVSNWMEPGDIYGALLDGEGNVIVNDIPMVDDHGMDNEGDQRVQSIAYNPDRNEFLAMWWDSRPSLDGGGVVGRIINPDGTPEGSDFIVADAPGSQSFPHAEYVEKRGMYFVIWDDGRNYDASEDEDENRDIYAKWLSPDGISAGDDIPVSTMKGSQRYSELAYNQLMDSFLIVYRNEVEEAVSEGGSGHIAESGGDILGKIYGVPSFLSCRVVDHGTGAAVEGARAVVLGLTLPTMETTGSEGWFNIAKDGQPEGKYFIIIYKNGSGMAIESVLYHGEPLQLTIELGK